MENAAEALKMAAAIIIFILALACSFSLFGTAKQTADSIIGMRDRQAYLEAAELDNGILYTSSSAIQGNDSTAEITTEYIAGVTKKGDRVVEVSDVISTIYRYSKEKYGVTIIKDGEVLARFDSATESIMRSWKKYIKDSYGNLVPAVSSENKQIYIDQLKNNLTNDYVTNIDLDLEKIYKSKTNDVYAPWGNDGEIIRRIDVDIDGGTFTTDAGNYQYEGKNLFSKLSEKKIIEVTNEIDESKYVENSNLLQQYKSPTVEIIYIIS